MGANTLVQPKRSGSSYIIWSNENRAKIVKSLGKDAGVTDVAKEAGKQWRALTATAEKKEKKVKDPNAPKRAPSAYLLWMKDSRAEIVKSLPKGFAQTEVMTAAGAQWKKLTAKAKAPYVKTAEKASADYKKAQEKYMASME